MIKGFIITSALLLVVFNLNAQSYQFTATRSPGQIVYQFPKDGDKYIQLQIPLIVRPLNAFIRNHKPSDFSFEVHGELSQIHTGKISISDDRETIIFETDSPFYLDEIVTVTFRIAGEVHFEPLTYSFRTTSLSESSQIHLLEAFEDKYENDRIQFRSQEQARSNQFISSAPLDTLPLSFPQITIDRNSPGTAPGTIFIAPNGFSNTTRFAYIIMCDNFGTPLYWKNILGRGTADFKVQPNGSMTFPTATQSFIGDLGSGTFFEMDSHFNIIDSFKMKNGYVADIHDFELLPNGHTMFDAYVPIQNGPITVYDNVIQELDSSGKVIFIWRALDHFHLGDTHEDTLAVQVDFAHINSIQTDTDGNILASFRNLDEVTKINGITGDIIWHLGGKHNQFAFLGDTLQISHQHDARRISNGHLTIWDNGNSHSVYIDKIPTLAPSSRAVEYALDETNHTAKTVWQFKNVPFSDAAGNVQRLANGNTFIGLGDVSSPSAMEVKPNGDVVFQLSLPYQTVTYRAYRFNYNYTLPPSQVSENASNENKFEISAIFPNPAIDHVTVSASSPILGDADIELSDILGHIVLRSPLNEHEIGNQTYELDLQGFPNGMYTFKLITNGKIQEKRFLIYK